MYILEKPLKKADFKPMEERMFGNFVKAVVDIEKKIIAIDAEMHADLEQFPPLKMDSEQKKSLGY